VWRDTPEIVDSWADFEQLNVSSAGQQTSGKFLNISQCYLEYKQTETEEHLYRRMHSYCDVQLTKNIGDKLDKPGAFAIVKLSSTQRNWSTVKKEAFASIKST